MGIDCEALLDLRRNAYVECTNLYLEKNNVLGVFADAVSLSGDVSLPLAEIYACGVVPIPIEGIDSAIFEYGSEEDVCDVIKSTLIYLKTDKCPLLYSSKMYVISNNCYAFLQSIKNASSKKIFSFDVTKKNSSDKKVQVEKMISCLCENYSCKYSETAKNEAEEKLNFIEKVLQSLEDYSALTSEELFLLRYFTPYITDLNARVEFFKKLERETSFNSEKRKRKIIRSLCPRGTYKKILERHASDDVVIHRAFSHCDTGYENCPLSKDTENFSY